MRRKKKGTAGNYIMRDKAFEILRLCEQGLNKSQISQAVKVHRKTVRDYLSRSKAFGVKSCDIMSLSEEQYREYYCQGQPGRKRDKAELDYEYISRELKRRGVTLLLLWEEYIAQHPKGCGYSHFCDCYNRWRKSRSVTMHMVHKAGEKVFTDYSGMKVPIYDRHDREKVLFEAEIFVGVLGASNYTYFEASRSQELEHWIGAHVRMFEYFGGVPEIAVPDNLKSGVTKSDYYEPGINRTYQDLADHYNFAVIPTRVKKPQDKAKVEKGVQVVQQRALALLRNQKFFSVAELNVALRELREKLNARNMKSYGTSRRELFENLDKPALKPLPSVPYEFSRYKAAKVHVDYHVQLFHCYYSVPYHYVRSEAELRYSEKTVEIFCKGERIAIHPKLEGKNKYSTLKEHMPDKHRFMEKWSPMRFLEWADRIGPETQLQINSILLSRKVPEQSYRSCLAILSLAKKYGNHRLEQACQTANDFGATSARSIKNIIENKAGDSEKAQEHAPVIHSNLRRDVDFH